MENEDKEFWNLLLANGSARSRFIRDLEIQSIECHTTEDLATRYHEEEMLPRHAPHGAYSAHSPATSRT